MAVSDESAGGRPKRNRLSKYQWRQIRIQYETGQESQRDLAKIVGVSESTLMKRAMREKWKQSAAIVQRARNSLQEKTAAAMDLAATEAVNLAAKEMIEDLQPLIQRERAEHIKAAVEIAKAARKRLSRMFASDELGPIPLDPKSESFVASAIEKYDNLGRRNLGMEQGAGIVGALNINILTGSAAVQFAQNAPAAA